jgi:hypothetical protein
MKYLKKSSIIAEGFDSLFDDEEVVSSSFDPNINIFSYYDDSKKDVRIIYELNEHFIEEARRNGINVDSKFITSAFSIVGGEKVFELKYFDYMTYPFTVVMKLYLVQNKGIDVTAVKVRFHSDVIMDTIVAYKKVFNNVKFLDQITEQNLEMDQTLEYIDLKFVHTLLKLI